jgi:hypothetical protein
MHSISKPSLTSSFLLVFFLVSVAGEFMVDDGESGLWND